MATKQAKRDTYLYRRRVGGIPVYVGISVQPVARAVQHDAGGMPGDETLVEVPPMTREKALAKERAVIEAIRKARGQDALLNVLPRPKGRRPKGRRL